MDTFTLIVTVLMGATLVTIILLGLFHPRTGAELLDWKPTRSPEVEAQNEIDDVAQMIAAQNRMRERSGKAPRTIEDVEAQVAQQEQDLRDYAAAYWAQQREERIAGVNATGGLTVYEVASCAKCRRLSRILAEREIDYASVDLLTATPSAERLGELFAKAGLTPRAGLREGEPQTSDLYARGASSEEILAAMAANPALIARPIVERGDRAVLARPTERALELL